MRVPPDPRVSSSGCTEITNTFLITDTLPPWVINQIHVQLF
jgi:hypothetical protein